MSVRRVMGTETEYAVSRADGVHANPVQLSFDVVGAAASVAAQQAAAASDVAAASAADSASVADSADSVAAAVTDASAAGAASATAATADAEAATDAAAAADAAQQRARIRWDYRQEDPVNDARGGRLPRAAARPDMLTDAPQLNIVNVIAANGGRIYVDHAHPEYSAPETTDPFEATRYDHAGDEIMREAARRASAATGTPIVLHRNNVDGKGSSWGTHENYMMSREVPFDTVARLMTAHFVSRQIYTGSGRVGLGERSETAGFQLSQRADYIHMKVGLQTTFDRPIINTRDESHSPSDQRRLHVIVGDANRMDVPQVLKLGVTSMLLWLAEHADEAGFDLDALLDGLALADPVAAMHEVSHDLTLSRPLALEQGGEASAWQMQVRLRMAVYEAAAGVYGTDTQGEPNWPDRPTRAVMAMWGQALADTAAIRHADDDARLDMADEARRVEWFAKWRLLERMRRRIVAAGAGVAAGESVVAQNDSARTDAAQNDAAQTDAGWDDPRIAALDLSWAALEPSASVFARLRAHTERVASDDEVAAACGHAPQNTRAWLRAAIVNRFPEQVVAASWSHLTVREVDESGAFAADVVLPVGIYGNASAAGAVGVGAGAGVAGAGASGAVAGTLHGLDMSDPLAFGRDAVESLLAEAGDAVTLIDRLSHRM